MNGKSFTRLLTLALGVALAPSTAANAASIQMLPPTDYSGQTCAGANTGLLYWDGTTAIKCVPATVGNSSGYLGIGTSAPNYSLDVNGNVNVESGGFYYYAGSPLAWAQLSLNNYFFGAGSGNSLITGSYNTGIGQSTLANLTSGSNNTALGYWALSGPQAPTSGSGNTAVGFASLAYDATGSNNTAVGVNALVSNTTGNDNTAVGQGAGGAEFVNGATTGNDNTAEGYWALNGLTSGSGNTAIGMMAMQSNTTGTYNTAIGYSALANGNDGNEVASSDNTAVGRSALIYNTTGDGNTAVGAVALANASTGGYNIAVGYQAGSNITTGSNNIMVGWEVQPPSPTADNQLNIGNLIFATGLGSGSAPSNGNVGIGNDSPSYVLDVSGQARFTGGYTTSDRRWKTNIEPLKDSLTVVDRLQGVTFDWRRKEFPDMHFDDKRHIGFIAQDVEKVLPDIVSTDNKGFKNVSYESVIPLLAEAMKQLKSLFDGDHSEIARLKADNDNLRAEHAADAKAIDELRREVGELKRKVITQ